MRHLVAVTSHPTTNELLVLNGDSELSYFKLQDSNPVLTSLVKLHVDSSFHNDNISLFFAFGLMIGLLWQSGAIALYDIHSGAEICKLEDLQGQNVHMWKSFHLANSIGFWSISGIWKLQSGTVLEISECIKSSVKSSNFGDTFPSMIQGGSNELCTKTDVIHKNYLKSTDDLSLRTELDTPSENFLIPELVKDQETSERTSSRPGEPIHADESVFAGPIFAASHLMRWNVNHRAAKLALDSILCSRILSDCTMADAEIPGVFLDLLVSEHAQSPAMALALLWEHPIHREFVLRKLERYIGECSDKCQTDKTFLNALLHPYMSEFLLLSKQCKSIIDSGFKEMIQSPSLPTNSVAWEVPALLEALDSGPLDVTSLERLSTLSHQQPYKVLEYVAEYLKIDSEQNDLQESQREQRWRKIYRLVW